MKGKRDIVVGVDFDNTIASYDRLMHDWALQAQLINSDVSVEKSKIRDHIRSLDDGEIKWQKLQAMVYGRYMSQAKLIEGVQGFFLSCYKSGIPIFVVSHKTQFAAQDQEKIDLHRVALTWIEEKGFFQDGSIFFEPSRQKKVERIGQLGCTHFIDDLLETFLEADFPKGVQKILYAPFDPVKIDQNVLVMSSWERMYDYFFAKIRK